MKILTAEKLREADSYTIKHEPIKSVDLMERAATACFNWIYDQAPNLFPPNITEEKDYIFYVVCGVGNNGGDGLVIARQLSRNGYQVKVVVVHISDSQSKDFKTNFDRLGKDKKNAIDVKSEKDVPEFPDDAVIIDAIFGTGLNRPVEGIARVVIQAMNQSGSQVVAIDMPSGLFDCNTANFEPDAITVSNHILTFQTPKLAFFLAENSQHVGKVHILDIGLDREFLEHVESDYHLADNVVASRLRRPRGRFTHKGSFGHALLIGSQKGKYGASMLSARSCLRSGCGLLTVHADDAGAALIHQFLPEAMHSEDGGKGHFSSLPKLDGYSAIGVGPGLGMHEDSVRQLKLLIQEVKVPLILDADALNILSENPTWMAFLPKNTILTPHPGEFARLAGEKLSHYDCLQKQRELSVKHGIYILLKGAHSSLSLPDGKIYINNTGNPGMATGGMGDTLTGIITGLAASGYSSTEAAILAMFVHGRAGDLALESQSVESLIATDLIAHIGKAFQSI
ncbi:MAG: NAD(P)H-hydrate dehydratase [Cryomorphaceae bacterium]